MKPVDYLKSLMIHPANQERIHQWISWTHLSLIDRRFHVTREQAGRFALWFDGKMITNSCVWPVEKFRPSGK